MRKIEEFLKTVDADFCRTVTAEAPNQGVDYGLYDTIAFIVARCARGHPETTVINLPTTVIEALKARGFKVTEAGSSGSYTGYSVKW